MKLCIVSLFLLWAAVTLNALELRDWENPAIFRINQTKPHVPLAVFDAAKEAVVTPFKKSPYLKLLNGAWQFHWSPRPEEAPANFYALDYDISRWDDITVPGDWQMQGFGHAKFRNVHQPFPAHPPLPPADYNPVGLYRTTFAVPATWDGRRIYLHFEGVKSAAYVWLNGAPLGFNQGGMEEFEFDVTDAVRAGDNVLAVQVFRYSAETYLESQDMWRLSGIYRDVYLFSTPQTHIRDYYARCDLDKNYQDAELFVDVDISASSESVAGKQVRFTLFDEKQSPTFKPVVQKLTAKDRFPITLRQKVKNPKKWSAEFPNLYTLTLELLDADGAVLEALATKFGFRETEIIDQAICVNGAPIKFNGVNSHVHHPETGRTMDVETMRKDLTLMKQFNINCVRTSHYPPNIEYLQLADELGVYIIDETNDESHATQFVAKDPAWRSMYVDRVTRMVTRDRNHPSIVFWSAGNESGDGPNIAAVIATGKKLDPTRPWMYGGNFLQAPYEEIIGPRYPTHDELEEIGAVPASEDSRPSFMDEYLAATGNSLGMLDEYWDIIYKHPRLTGGAIWDWVSPGIIRPIRLTPDSSNNHIMTHFMGHVQLVNGRFGKAAALSGQDEWIECYRHPALDITGDQLSLSLWLYPRRWNGHGPLVAKGDQYGLRQIEADQVEFYLHVGALVSVRAKTPADWAYKWHHLAGVYDGTKMTLYIDGRLQAESPQSGRIDRSAFAAAIGKNALRDGQEHAGELCNAVIDQVRIYDRAVAPQTLLDDEASGAQLRLDFESVEQRGNFYSLGIGGRSYGLIWGDRTPQPEMQQLKKTPQPVKIELVDSDRQQLRILNRHNFKNLDQLDCFWALQQDGEFVQQGKLAVAAPPRETTTVVVPFDKPALVPGAEYFLYVRFVLPRKTSWADSGYVVAWEQMPLESSAASAASAEKSGDVRVEERGDEIIISGKDFSYRFDKTNGLFSSAVFHDHQLLKRGPVFNAFRAPTANELERQWGPRIIADEWRAAGLDQMRQNVKNVQASAGRPVRIVVNSDVSADGCSATFHVKYLYSFFADGSVEIETHVACRGEFPEWLPKIGLQMRAPKELNTLQWYGRGPCETYPDRKTGAPVGLYREQVEKSVTPYLIPQDYGNKTDVRWAALVDEDGIGWFVRGSGLLNISAHPYSTQQLDRAWYPFQLQQEDAVYLNIDHLVSGLGGTPIKTLEKYRVKPGEYEFTIRLKPIDTRQVSPVELGRRGW